MRPRRLLMCALSCTAALRLGEAARAADEVLTLPEVEVVDERVREPEQRAPTAFVTIVDVPAREAPIETTAEVLGETVGVQVQRFGGLGAFSTISIRGSTANQVAIYLDGIPLSQAQDQTVNLSDLPLDSLERIDVYRGTIPVGFGGGGIGGVVNLVTRPPTAEPRTELVTGYGSFQTRKAVATHSRRSGDTSLLAHVSYLGSEGNFTFDDDNGTPENPTDDEVATRINNAFNAGDALFKLSHDFGDALFLDVVQEVFGKEQGVPGPGNTQFARPSLTGIRSLSYLRLRQSAVGGAPLDGVVNLFGLYNLQEFSDPEGNFGSVQQTRNQTALAGGSTTGTWYAPYEQALSWFLEGAYEQFFPYNETNPPALPKDGPDQTRLRLTLAAQDEAALFDRRLLIVPSLRYDHFVDAFSGVNLANFPDTPTATTTLDLFTPAIGIEARPLEWLRLRGNIGRFQRAPNFSELFGNGGSVLGNAALEPETGINRDLGVIATWPAFDWLDGGLLELAYFYNNVSDLIAFEQASPKQFRPFNIGDARIAGVEVGASAGAFGHLGLDLNYTNQDSENRSVDSPEGNQLPLRPADELFVRPRLFNDWASVWYEFTYLSANPTDADNFEIVPSRSIHTVGCSVQPLPWLTARFEAANVTNADIRDLGDFPLPGLSFFGGLKAVF